MAEWQENIPGVIFDANPGYVKLYEKTWQLAHDHIRTRPGLPQSPYMDEAFCDDQIWIWDTCFMAHFCKYGFASFPGVESLRNFYAPIHDGERSSLQIHITDNPPLFAWTELQYYKLTGDRDHLDKLLNRDRYLQRHYEWFDLVQPGFMLPDDGAIAPVCLQRVDAGYFWEGGRSGMDNTPRGRTGKHAVEERPNNPKMLWLDAIAQQGLSALCISQIAAELGNAEEQQKYKAEYEKLKALVNELYWCEEDGIYYDIHVDTHEHMKVKTPASYWPILAEMASPEQAKRMAGLLEDPETFGGVTPWVTLARNDADFNDDDGNYWRGGVWLPTAYMGIKALEKYGHNALADKSAEALLTTMLQTYENYEPHTIWECYSPSKPEPAKHLDKRVRPDFCGWSALGPISLMIENVLGFHTIDAPAGRVEWRLHQQQRHGITNLRFGQTSTDIIADGLGGVTVTSDQPYTLVINGEAHKIQAGENELKIESAG